MATNLAVPFTNIPTQEKVPLWPGWVARRHVTLMVAPGGTGKGLLTIYMAAIVSNGLPWPGEPEGTIHEPENVILVAPEDDPNEDVAVRLAAAGADVKRVFNLTILPDGSPFQLPGSMPKLYAAMKEIEELTGAPVGLVIIDPLYATLEKGHTVATNGGAREITTPLEKLAQDSSEGGTKLGAAVILTHHTVKSGKTAGAKGLTDSVRQVIRLETPDTRTELTRRMRELSIEKFNNGDSSKTLRYILLGDNDIHLGFPPADTETSEARGYLIAKPIGGQAPVDHDVRLIHTEAGGSPQTDPRTFTSTADAQVAAEQIVGYPLPWKNGTMHGMLQAAGTEHGTIHTFTVMDLTVARG